MVAQIERRQNVELRPWDRVLIGLVGVLFALLIGCIGWWINVWQDSLGNLTEATYSNTKATASLNWRVDSLSEQVSGAIKLRDTVIGNSKDIQRNSSDIRELRQMRGLE